ncbi:MAG TPA: hypothetical protein VLZ31_07305, partial [Microbacteriaceae bacterium]|nr:hypothetical protein [Microbacteriaceae bacterium]
MSVFLYRLGRFSYSRPWVFIVTWLIILGSVIVFALTTSIKISSAITIDGTESQRVIEELREEFPETSGGQGTIVFTTADNESLAEGDRADAIRSAMNDISSKSYVIERSAESLAIAPPQTNIPIEGYTPPAGAIPPEGATPPEGLTPPEGITLPDGITPPENANILGEEVETTDKAIADNAPANKTPADKAPANQAPAN